MVDHVRPKALPAWFASLSSSHAPLVLDVREPWELQTACIATEPLELLAIPMGLVPAHLSRLNPERPIACLCHHGVRSLRVATFLEQQGFQHVANISGGIDAWSQTVDPSVPQY
ncbi:MULTISPECIES: rhodanese-like domain-containing protein [Giesbergeria]|uniref:Rhodanese-like domain-containing protein n=1 Tax=Giesbergeria sinuosa TaxID=80883 RepID=A0ABV9QH44_9BURK